MNGILLEGRLVVTPEHFEAVCTVAAEVSRQSEEEPGCLKYLVGADLTTAHALVFLELYADSAAFDAHKEQPYARAFAEMLAGKLSARALEFHRIVSNAEAPTLGGSYDAALGSL